MTRLQRFTRHLPAACGVLAAVILPATAAGAPSGAPRTAEVLVNVFRSHCIVCHGEWRREADLDLRTRASMLRGGKSGPALVPGRPGESLVLTRLLRDEMPPEKDIFGDKNYVRRVKAGDIELLREWIAAGAPSEPPPEPERRRASTRDHWAFRPPRRPDVPTVRAAHRVRQPIDAFLLRRLEEKQLSLSATARPTALLRRLTFAITGLAPTPAEVNRFLEAVATDGLTEAYEREVDRLLASPSYGEHWATPWLDSVGHADTHGRINRDELRRYAWRYRDYVIRALNEDKPYDRFLLEQIAGDELFDYEVETEWTSERRDGLIATGFLRTAADDTDELALNFVPNRRLVLDDQVAAFSTAVLGLTLACARCHDHKFDPISQRDYYKMSAVFEAAYDPFDWRIPGEVIYPPRFPVPREYRRLLDDPLAEGLPELARYNRPIETRIATLVDQLKALGVDAGAPRTRSAEQELGKEAKDLLNQLEGERARLMKAPKILALFDTGGTPNPSHLLHRGDSRNPREQVEPGVPQLFEGVVEPYVAQPPPFSTRTTGRRLGLARWLVNKDHPLTARVIVNRIWQQHFGRGLVLTPGNFGTTGAPPTHPELLDWLATELVRSSWSIKSLQRAILTSEAYRQASRIDEELLHLDPENELLSRFPLRRLTGEEVRDTLLQVAGRLEATPYGPADDIQQATDGEISVRADPGLRRSVYAIRRRLKPVTLLDLFGAPRLMSGCLKRVPATVPTQALQLWNSRLSRDCGTHMAKRVAKSAGDTPHAQVRAAYFLAFGRPPSAKEIQEDSALLDALRREWQASSAPPETGGADPSAIQALATFCHTLLNAPEFLYVD